MFRMTGEYVLHDKSSSLKTKSIKYVQKSDESSPKDLRNKCQV